MAEPTGMVNLSSGIPQGFIGSGVPRVRSSQASKGGEHPRVVLGQPKYYHTGDLVSKADMAEVASPQFGSRIRL